jgi:hypothetical protein
MLVLSTESYTFDPNDPIAGLIFKDQQGQKFSAPLLSSHVDMKVNGLINRVTVKQIFKNESDQWINASYLFPLPDKSAVDHLRLKIADRVIEGEIKPTEQQNGFTKKHFNQEKRPRYYHSNVAIFLRLKLPTLLLLKPLLLKLNINNRFCIEMVNLVCITQ